MPACERFGIGVLPFFPLANGLLTGKYRRGEPPPPNSRLASRPDGIDEDALEVVERIEAFAAERGVSVLDVAIGGLAAQPAVAVGDRRRHDTRAGHRERRRRHLAADDR